MLPVHEGEPDKVIGVIVRKDLIDIFASGKPLDIRSLVKPAPVVLDRADAISVLAAIRNSVVHMALVFDEYGHFEGIVTPGDILGAIIGDFQEEEGGETAFTRREDGSYLVSGWMQVDEFSDKIGVPTPKDPPYETVAGYLLSELNHLPVVGETFTREPWRFEVLDMDGRRIDKVLVTRLDGQPAGRSS
jgi:putative hemolysin